MTSSEHQKSAALGALYGAAIGDALGMPTQDLTPQVIAEDYGPITGFVDAGPRQIIAAGQKAGTITDDTEQMVIVAELLGADKPFDPREFAERLDAWEQDMKARGSLDLLGPSTKAAIEAIRQGKGPEESGRTGTTNGAAMRAAPIGIACPPMPVDRLVDLTFQVCQVTHNTAPAMAAAGAVAGAVSAGVEGAPLTVALSIGRDCARRAELRAPAIAGPGFVARWDASTRILRSSTNIARDIYSIVGTTVTASESVVAALCICDAIEDPWEALCVAAGIGGDTDTVATIVGAILGASQGIECFPTTAIETVKTVNNLSFDALASKLLHRRTVRTDQ